jgi:protein gp37
VRFVHDALDAPIHWKKPRRIFVNSMSDLFHEKVEAGWLIAISMSCGAPAGTRSKS